MVYAMVYFRKSQKSGKSLHPHLNSFSNLSVLYSLLLVYTRMSIPGDQFKLPEQAPQLETFFTVFYFSINCGSLLSTIITPLLREVQTVHSLRYFIEWADI